MNFRVKELCKEKGILFKSLAQQIGITDVGLRQSLQGNPTIGTLEKIAAALGVEVTELFAPTPKNTITCPKCGAVLSLEEYDPAKETKRIIQSPETMAAIRKSIDDIDNGRVVRQKEGESITDFLDRI